MSAVARAILVDWATSTKLSDDPGTAAQSSVAIAYVGGELATSWRDDRSGNADVRARRTSGDHFALGYDGLNRLTGVTLLNPESFVLDGASNITSRTGPVQTDSYDLSNRLTSDGTQTYTWSDADRLTGRGADIFGYDPLDRLTSSTVAGSARVYAYNGDDLLQSRTGSGATTLLWDPNSSPSRLLKQGSDNLVYGLGPLYVVKSDATTLTFARDGSKNVRAEINPSGAVTASFRYRAYGQIAQSTASSPTYLGYAAQLLDPSGLYYLRARWYDPAAARFLSRDALDSGNSFGYASANPISNGDPFGLMTVPIEIAGPTCSCTGPWGDILRPRGDPQPISKWGGWQIIADPLPPTCAPPCGWIVDPAPPVAGLAILIFVPPPPFDGVNRDDAINLDGERKALRKIAQEAADAGGVTAKEAAILERWRAELGMPGHDVVSGHGAGVPNDSPWKTMPHWKVGGRDSIHVPIRGEQ